jgi:hypothetical protein
MNIIMYPPNTLGTYSDWFILDVVKEWIKRANVLLLCRFFKDPTLCMTKLKVLVLCFSHFIDNFPLCILGGFEHVLGSGAGESLHSW